MITRSVSLSLSVLTGDVFLYPYPGLPHAPSSRLFTQAQMNPWFIINLHKRAVAVTHYTLRHVSAANLDALRNWKFLGTRRTYARLTESRFGEDQGDRARERR